MERMLLQPHCSRQRSSRGTSSHSSSVTSRTEWPFPCLWLPEGCRLSFLRAHGYKWSSHQFCDWGSRRGSSRLKGALRSRDGPSCDFEAKSMDRPEDRVRQVGEQVLIGDRPSANAPHPYGYLTWAMGAPRTSIRARSALPRPASSASN